MDIQLRHAEDIRAAIEQQGKDEIAARAKQQQGREFAQGIIVADDPIAQAQAELERKSQLLAQYAEQDQANAQIYAEAKVELERQTAERIKDILADQERERQAKQSAALMAYSSTFDSLASITRDFAGKQSGIYKAMFAVAKAFAIADAIIKIQQGIAAAASQPWPLNLAAMASVAAATSSIVSNIKSVQFSGGRRHGGPANAGSMYRVNEAGRPEMFTAANGAQYMLPTKSGKVTPAGSGGGGVKIIVNNNNGSDVRDGGQDSDGNQILNLERRVVSAVAADTRSGGQTARATAARFGTSNGATLNRRRA